MVKDGQEEGSDVSGEMTEGVIRRRHVVQQYGGLSNAPSGRLPKQAVHTTFLPQTDKTNIATHSMSSLPSTSPKPAFGVGESRTLKSPSSASIANHGKVEKALPNNVSENGDPPTTSEGIHQPVTDVRIVESNAESAFDRNEEKRREKAPGEVVDVKVEKLSLLAYELSWKPSSGAESYIVQLKMSGEESIIENHTKSSRYTVENLEPAETYTITIVALNSAGRGWHSEPETFNTDVLPPRRIDVRIEYVGNSVTLEVKILEAMQNTKAYIVGDIQNRLTSLTTRTCYAVFSNLPYNSTYILYAVAVGKNGEKGENKLSEKIVIGNRPTGNSHCSAHQIFHHSFAREVVVGDGVIYTRERDAPGQNCQYIPPGNHNSEKYRLGTFSVYPNDVPVNATDMAAAGFYFTGYKDRVKCFSCGIAVENWMLGDDVMDIKWHKSDCRMAFGRDERNIPISTPNFRGILRMFAGNHANVRRIPSLAFGHKNYAQFPASNSGFENYQVASVNSATNNITDVTTNFKGVQVSDSHPSLVLANVLSVEHENLLRSLNLKNEADRRKTYLQWPSYPAPYLPTDLAKEGFFYLGNLDRTQCFSCSGVLRNWAPYDNAKEQHQKHFPNCRIVRMMDSGNIPLSDDDRRAADEAELVRISALLPSTDALVEPPDPSPEEQRHLAEYFPCTAAVNIHMQRIERRIETFARGWPRERVRASPEATAKAGFFYLGESDKTKCFYCNGGLQNWETNDEPWTEHAKWFPGCEFVLRCKGVEFVRRLAEAHPNLNRPYIRNPVSFDIPPREVERTSPNLSVASHQGLDLNHVESIGFSREQIEKAIQLKRNRGGYATTQELIDDLLKENSDNNAMEVQSGATAAQVGIFATETSGPGLVAAQAGQKREAGAEASETTRKRTRSTSPSLVGEMGKEFEELRRATETGSCRNCKKRTADNILIPCGHLSACSNCVPGIRRCLICNHKVESFMKIYRA